MSGHDPVLILLIVILGLVALGAARGKLQTLAPRDPTWDVKKLKKMRRSKMEPCVYCHERDTSNRDSDGDPMCIICESKLLP